MSAGKRNIEIIKGDDYSHIVNLQTRTGNVYTPIDITGRVYTAQIRKVKAQLVPDAAFTCVVTDAVNGEITISMASEITADLKVGCYYWDLQQDASGVINTILSGEATVVSDTTR